MEQMPPHSPNLARSNVDRLIELFPSVLTEMQDVDGNTVRAIDFDLLKQELSDQVVEGPRERYHLDWPGKRAAAFTANAPTAKTLRPARDESIDFDTTKNVFIEGDNLETLKLLQESYLGAVKLIYIDPPYNTGNDFVYQDDFTETAEDYLRRSGATADTGQRMIANLEANGRFHSDWLSMMYPRLRLARSLLAPDGAIFVSIDDHERDNLKRLMDEVFGEQSFVGSIIWRKKASPDARSTIGAVHDYILCYVRDPDQAKAAIGKMALSAQRIASFTNPDGDPRGPWASVDMTGMTGRATKDQYFSVTLPSGRVVTPPEGRSWGLVERTFEELRADGRIWFGKDGNNVPRIKRFLAETSGQTVPTYWDFADVGSNEEATNEVTKLFGGLRVFDTPKPVRLMKRILEIATRPNDEHLVLDFFAGSSSLAQAVLEANKDDGGDRRFLMVQAGEQCSPKSDAAKAGYLTIAELSRERIRRASSLIAADAKLPSYDGGFRVLVVDTSNRVPSAQVPQDLVQSALWEATGSLKPDRSADDLLFQVLIEWGLPLSSELTRERIGGDELITVDGGALVVYFCKQLDLDVLRQIAARQPMRVVLRDSSFADDADRINAEQIFAELSAEIDVKVI
jgi:adenine-specific DNA-methyltransferase